MAIDTHTHMHRHTHTHTQEDYPATATDWKFKIVKLADAPTEANDDPWSFEVD